MSRGSRVASTLVVMCVGCGPLVRAQTTQGLDAVRVFSIEYADGRTVRYPVLEKNGNMWTPLFPRVAGADTTSDGLQLSALEVTYVVDGRDLSVGVALRYGMPHQKRVPIATVRLTDERPVRVDELSAFGVQPITVAILSLARPDLPIPTVTLPSSLLEATVTVDTRGAPRYLISITNHAQQGVMALAFQGYRGNEKGLSGKPHTPNHTPLVGPGEAYTLSLMAAVNGRATGAGDLWKGMDRIVFTSVTWSDGIVEGSERPAAETKVVDAATARQLAHALALMRGAQAADPPDVPQLRADIASLSIDDADAVRAAASDSRGVDQAAAVSLTRIGMQLAKDALLKDVDEFMRDPQSGQSAARHEWLTSAVAKFDGWRTRIVTAPR